jgi:hypothetical protein
MKGKLKLDTDIKVKKKEYVADPDARQKYREKQQIFIRAHHRMTFREKAMQILDSRRNEFVFEMDE